MYKFVIEATGRKVDGNMNIDGVAGYAENKNMESACCDRNYSDKRIQTSLPEGKSSPMGLGGCESKFFIQFVVRVEAVTVLWLKDCGGQGKV